MYLIYSHTNKINGKRYIGLTSHAENPNKRWRDGLAYLNNHHKVFAAAITKYGWNNFIHEILETNISSLAEANKREKFWIEYYHTYVGDPGCKGYNCTKGGDGVTGIVPTDEYRNLRRKLKLGTKASVDTKRKMSIARKGKPQNMTSKKLEACKKQQMLMVDILRKPVICVETGERWKSVTEAAEALGVAETTVSAALNGRQKTVRKLHVQYLKKET